MSKLSLPKFEQVLVEDNIKDGYWIDAVDVNGDGRPDMIASGLAEGNIVWYENPTWRKCHIVINQSISKCIVRRHI